MEEGYPQERIDFVIRDTRSKVVIDFNWLEHCLPNAACLIS